jgi:hypothetical protein
MCGAGVSAKGALSTVAWGIAPWYKPLEKSRAPRARFTSKHLFTTGGRLKLAFSAWSVLLFRYWGEAPGYD